MCAGARLPSWGRCHRGGPFLQWRCTLKCVFCSTLFNSFFDFVFKTFSKLSENFQFRSSFSHAHVTLWTPKVVPKMSHFGTQKLHLAAVAPWFFRAPGHPSPRPPNLNYGTGWALRRRLGVPTIQIGGLGGTWQCKVRGCGGRAVMVDVVDVVDGETTSALLMTDGPQL